MTERKSSPLPPWFSSPRPPTTYSCRREVELAAQDEALTKHDERLSRLSALHRGDAEEETVQEKHFRAEGLRDATKSVLRTLGDLAKAYPELKDVLNATLQDHGLHPELLAG